MTELEVRRAIIYAIDECKSNGQPIRERIESVIAVETLATAIAFSLTKQGLLKVDVAPERW
jgi:hypothetical protein